MAGGWSIGVWYGLNEFGLWSEQLIEYLLDAAFDIFGESGSGGHVTFTAGLREFEGQAAADEDLHAAAGVAAIGHERIAELCEGNRLGVAQGDERLALTVGEVWNRHDGQDAGQGLTQMISLPVAGFFQGVAQSYQWRFAML